MDYCNFCFNAHVQPDDYDDYLDDTNDFHSISIGSYEPHIKLYLNGGYGDAVNIEVLEWLNGVGHTVAKYYPKFCPECGRRLDEYIIDDRGMSFKRKELLNA